VAIPSWDDHNQARRALQAIVSDPGYGAPALSSPQAMTSLLKDLLPDAPREANILIAAAAAGVPSTLQDHISRGMDVGTASRLVAGSFAARSAFKPEACSWAVGELAVALGLDPSGQGAAGTWAQPGGAQEAVTLKPGAESAAGYQQGGYQQASYHQDSQQAGYQQPGYQQSDPQQSGYQQPGYQQPGYQQPGYQQAGYQQGGYQQPGAQQGGSQQGGYQQPGYQQSGYQQPGYQQPGYQQPGYQQPGYQATPAAQYWAQRNYRPVKTNGLAIASLVLSIVWFFWLGSVAGLILGLVALKQTKQLNEGGRGLAIAGIIVSGMAIISLILIIIVGAVTSKST
jgi:Domain of unknown function (DUF4190)